MVIAKRVTPLIFLVDLVAIFTSTRVVVMNLVCPYDLHTIS